MKYLSIFSLYFCLFARADLVNDRIAKILPGELQNKEALILLSGSGRVLRTSDIKIIQTLSQLTQKNEALTFIEDNAQILSYARTSQTSSSLLTYDDNLPSLNVAYLPTTIHYTDSNYTPSNLEYIGDAQNLMSNLKDNRRSGSECYQRAHLWTIEMNKMANVHSQKIFLFFTEKYMREYSFDWWFHVAPFVLINGMEYVIDPRFFSHPADPQQWSNFFMPSHPTCKTVSSYKEYEDHQESEYCYFRKIPMYYFEPMDIEARDNAGTIIPNWVDWQTDIAYDSLFRKHKWIQ